MNCRAAQAVEAGLAALEAQPRVIREVLMRGIVEACAEGQREAYRVKKG